MQNFIYKNPVKIVFGKGMVDELCDLIPENIKIMLTYGGGSIKKNGVYQKIKSVLRKYDIFEFGGIEANPEYHTLLQAVDIINKNNIQFLLAVGGGSVIDATKFIAAAALYPGQDKWDILAKGIKIEKALPLGCVLTIPATGSEMNGNAVISRRDCKQKWVLKSPHVYPQFSILDPEFTYSLPARQLANGIVDAYVHVTEQYLNYKVDAPLQDRQAEAILLTLIEEAPKILHLNKDYTSRANFMWCATHALNGIIGCGVPGDWSTHLIGHELTAQYGIDHGQSLALILPAVLGYRKEQKRDKLIQYAEKIWKIDSRKDQEKIDLAIRKTIEFFHSVGMKTSFKEYNIKKDRNKFAKIADNIINHQKTKLGEHKDIGKKEIVEILMSVQE